ncbi:enterochelin esterase [Alcaligenaceae bacterium]|nr:enterochelin esterase [Alcaligenaceae bacterium]
MVRYVLGWLCHAFRPPHCSSGCDLRVLIKLSLVSGPRLSGLALAWSLLLTGCSTASLDVARHGDDAGTVLKAGQRTATSDIIQAGGKASASPTSADPSSPRLRALKQTLASGGGTETFWKELASSGTPLIEPVAENESLVTFLWRGAHDSVRLFGSPSGNHDALQRLGDSDVWWVSYRMPNTARLSYRLAPDVPAIQGSPMDQRRAILATAQRDPLNPNVFPPGDDTRVDVFQGDSALSLPDAPTQAWIAPRADVKPGVLQSHRFISTLLGNERNVWTYIPNGATPKALLVLFDAQAYLERVPTPIIIDNLIADGLIPTTAVVLIDNPSRNARSKELPPNPEFAGFLDKELMPWVQAQGLLFPANRTVIAGSSYGGLASAYAGLTNPQWFGNVLSLSGSYWWAPENSMPGWMMRQYAQAPRKNVRFYLDAGRYESGRTGQYGILETSRHLGDVLRAKGYTVTQVEHDTGHDYLHWQGSLACGLVALLAPKKFNALKQCAGQAPPAD